MYNELDPDKLNKETLIGDTDFLIDASTFLVAREGYEPEQLEDPEAVYDAFMEHFRYQNVNEVTAARDLIYAQSGTDDQGRERMGRLMDTFDKMDSDLGWEAAGDYLGGVFTAPSTYAGIFSFGAGKAGALAANQSLKFGIRQALKPSLKRAAAQSVLIDAPVGGATVAAQEKIRVDTGLKDQMDMSNIATATAVSGIAPFVLGTGLGVKKELTSYGAEQLVKNTKKLSQEAHENAYGNYSKKVLESNTAQGKLARDFVKKLSPAKKSMEETIPKELKKGKILRESEPIGLDETVIQNISAAGARVYNMIPPRVLANGKRAKRGSKQDLEERFSSRIARGVIGGEIKKEELSVILKEHNITIEQLGALYAEELSRAGRLLGSQSAMSRKAKELRSELNQLDAELLSMGNFTASAKKRINEESGMDIFSLPFDGIKHLNKARIGLMTIQLATTARNTTNGYMRNYVYALDNLGAGLGKVAYGATVGKARGLTDDVLRAEANRSVRAGVAQLRAGTQALWAKDLWLNTNSVTTEAAARLLRDDEMGNSSLYKEMFKEMGDIGNFTDADGGLVAMARWLNGLNTMSDNMFKRAIFSRELDKAIQTEYGTTLSKVIQEGKFGSIDNTLIADAMNEAMEFTYQTGRFKGRKGIANDFADFVIKAGSTTLGSTVVPFPRYLVNQARFWYEHTPLLGMVNMGGILNKPGKSFDTLKLDSETFGKQLSGIVTLFTFLQMRANLGDESTGAYEYNYPAPDESMFAKATGVGGAGYFDARASIGPFAMHAALADIMYRMMPHLDEETYMFTPQNPDVAKGISTSPRDLVYALTGGLGRAGTGANLIDSAVDIGLNGLEGDVSGEDIVESIVEYLGDVVNTATVGAGVIKDIVATVDPDFRKVPNNTDVSVLGYFIKQVTRSMPQTTDPNVDGLYGYYMGVGPQREGIAHVPTRSTGIDVVNPIVKQLSGFTEQQEKTLVERELGRLRIDFAEITPRRIRKDRPMTNEMRGLMGEYVERNIASYIQSDVYNNIDTDVEKRIELKKQLGVFKSAARARMLNRNKATTVAEVQRVHRAMYYNISKDDRKILNARYKDALRADGWSPDDDTGLTGDIVKDKMYVYAFSLMEDIKDLDESLYGRFDIDDILGDIAK